MGDVVRLFRFGVWFDDDAAVVVDVGAVDAVVVSIILVFCMLLFTFTVWWGWSYRDVVIIF